MLEIDMTKLQSEIEIEFEIKEEDPTSWQVHLFNFCNLKIANKLKIIVGMRIKKNVELGTKWLFAMRFKGVVAIFTILLSGSIYFQNELLLQPGLAYMRPWTTEMVDKSSISQGVNDRNCFSEINPNRLLITPSHSGAGHTMAIVNCYVKVAAHLCLRPVLSSWAGMSHGLGRALLEEFFGHDNNRWADYQITNRVELFFSETHYENQARINTISRRGRSITSGALFTMKRCTPDTDYESTREWLMSLMESNSKLLAAYKREKNKRKDLVIAVHIRRGDIVKIRKYRNRLIKDRVFIDLTTTVIKLTDFEIPIRVVVLTEAGESGYENENGQKADICGGILEALESNHTKRLDPVTCELKMGSRVEDTLDSFFTLVTADIMITSKSGFSHLAAVFSRGVKYIWRRL